jgi:uncharacterized protein
MWHYSRRAVQQWIQSILHTHDTPERTAAALGLGVALAFSPFLGLHILLAIGLAFLLRLNRVAVFAGLCANLPWMMGAYYPAATALGTWILRTPIPPNLIRQLATFWELPGWTDRAHALASLVGPLFWPFMLGSTIGSVVFGFAAYRVALPVLIARRRHQLQSSGKAP